MARLTGRSHSPAYSPASPPVPSSTAAASWASRGTTHSHGLAVASALAAELPVDLAHPVDAAADQPGAVHDADPVEGEKTGRSWRPTQGFFALILMVEAMVILSFAATDMAPFYKAGWAMDLSGELEAGTTKVGLAVVGFLRFAPSWIWSPGSCVQANEEANFDAVPSRVTVEVGMTPGWSGPAFACGGGLFAEAELALADSFAASTRRWVFIASS